MVAMRFKCVTKFARALFNTLDLDPLYVMIHRANLPRPKLAEYILAYWCFYHTGTCSWIVDQPCFWTAMADAAKDARHPRGSDRRHFRGAEAIRAVRELREEGLTAEGLLDAVLGPPGAGRGLRRLMGRLQEWRAYGPTIAFKAADMLDRLWGGEVRSSVEDDSDLISAVPRKGAKAVAEADGRAEEGTAYACRKALSGLGEGRLTPPLFDRAPGLLEAETVLCKWSHYLSGSYYLGKGTESQRKGLVPYLSGETARRMYEAGRESGLWD